LWWWKSGNPKPGFPLSHHPERLRQQGRKAFFKKNNANPKTVYTKLLTPPASIQVIYRLSAHRPSGRQRQGPAWRAEV
jgi:hypothetical protein